MNPMAPAKLRLALRRRQAPRIVGFGHDKETHE
jgi:hypothetical protein